MLTLGIEEGTRKDSLKNTSLNLTWLAGCSYWVYHGSRKKNKRNNKHSLNNPMLILINCVATSHVNLFIYVNQKLVNSSSIFCQGIKYNKHI